MFNINEIPTLIKKRNTPNKQFIININTKRTIRLERNSKKKSVQWLMNKYKLTRITINQILKETT